MADVIKTTFQLRRGKSEVWKRNNPILAYGEPGFIIDENRLKVGDGVTPWNELDYLDEGILRGYFYNNWFYKDAEHTIQIQAYTTKFYFDIPNSTFYFFDGDQYQSFSGTVQPASDTKPGIMKLYQKTGENVDGAMSQKSITQTVNKIQFATDEQDSECLILNLPQSI